MPASASAARPTRTSTAREPRSESERLLGQTVFRAYFRSPVLLAAGTCGFGEAIVDVMDLGGLGGLVTKSVTLEPRAGNPAPRVAEFPAGMMNSIGLANPGVEGVLAHKLPWIREHLIPRGLQVFVSVAGHSPSSYLEVVSRLDGEDGFLGYELNLSCPNDTERHALPFALDPEALTRVVSDVRARTSRPLLVKLAPNTPDLSPIIEAAERSGADGLTLVNTLPGLVLDPHTHEAVLGAGAGGMSGPALRAVGVHATWRARSLTTLPLVGVGGIGCGEDALQYLLAGATLVQIGTASFWDPRTGPRVTKQLTQLARAQRIRGLADWIGAARVGPSRCEPGAAPAPR
jgi:dihydroorotate dehydrogenase (NAD+) catalytic subunit